MKTDIIIARADNLADHKRNYYLTVYIEFCDYIANLLKLQGLPHVNTISEALAFYHLVHENYHSKHELITLLS